MPRPERAPHDKTARFDAIYTPTTPSEHLRVPLPRADSTFPATSPCSRPARVPPFPPYSCPMTPISAGKGGIGDDARKKTSNRQWWMPNQEAPPLPPPSPRVTTPFFFPLEPLDKLTTSMVN